MAQIGAFDASTIEPQTSYTPYPIGDYVMQIIRSEVKPTSKGDGSFLEMEFDILDGAFAGRKFFDRLNLWNPNETTVKIAQSTLSALCRATGRMQIADSEELHFQPLLVKMKVTPRKDRPGEMQNNATYVALDGAAPAAPAAQYASAGQPAMQRQQPPQAQIPAYAPAAPAAPGATGAKPWERHKRTA